MNKLFPPEIIKSSSENYFSEQSHSSRSIYLAILSFLIVAGTLLPLIHVQVTTQSEGVIRSNNEDNPIIPVVSGEVLSCRISENQQIQKEDTLLIIATDRIDQDIKLLSFRQKEDSLLLSDLNLLVKGQKGRLTTSLYKQDHSSFSVRLDEQRTQVQLAESEYLLAEKLFNKGVTPKHEFEKIKSQLCYERSRFSSVQNQQFTIWQEKRKETAMRLAELQSQIKQLQKEKDLYYITAPITGTIIGYNGIQKGNFVVPNQLVAKIASDSDLLIECFVTPNDIGLIETGMPASFQLHAFNYNLWGMATGKVNEISKNVTSVNNRPFFRIKCKLDQQFLQLKNGYKGNLKKGMTLTGRFKVTERTLFQLLYDKADNWLNPKRENG